MQRRVFYVFLCSLWLIGAGHMSAWAGPSEPVPLRVITHSAFDLPAPLLAAFEKEAGVRLQIIKAGSAGEMVNKLLLTRSHVLADVVFGVDNAALSRLGAAGLFEPYNGPAAQRAAAVKMSPEAGRSGVAAGVVPVQYGYVTLNVDRAWFARKALAWPRSLHDLTLPAYRDLLVVQNPHTSSAGLAFLWATVAGLGETAAFDWWAAVRANGAKVAKGWSEAYYTDFSRNGGSRPIVVSYASSPAAEVFFAKTALAESPTANVFVQGGVFGQVEGVALLKGGNPAARAPAMRFIEFLRSPAVQQALQTSMWMLPAELHAQQAEVMRLHASEPSASERLWASPTPAQSKAWLRRWTQVVLR